MEKCLCKKSGGRRAGKCESMTGNRRKDFSRKVTLDDKNAEDTPSRSLPKMTVNFTTRMYLCTA